LRVLKKLGNPHLSLPPTVHIAGTNGKGSTAAFLCAMAKAQGLKVHIYTSPHLVDIRERIVLAGDMIEADRFADALTRTSKAADGQPLTHFEALTAAAFLAFSETPADLLILETGLGGRYDATNVLPAPAACAITPIDYDHAEFLGRDLAKIAREKAGIFKPFAPAFSAPQSELVRAVLGAEAAKARTSLAAAGEDFHCYAQHDRLVYEDQTALLDLPLPNLTGAHQTINAGLAIAVARSLQIEEKAIAKGITSAVWPGRLQQLSTGNFTQFSAPAQTEIWLDGGHNPHAGRALAEAMAEQETRSSRPLVLIVGMLANKDAPGFLDAFEGLAHTLIAVPVKGHASLAAETLMDIAKGRAITALRADNLKDAVKMACPVKPGPGPRILICGSLYLVGEALSSQIGAGL